MKYDKHRSVIDALNKAMEADHDNRERARESKVFLSARDGQWEPEWSARAKDKPQYTFDMVEPLVDQICGDVSKADFDSRVLPAGGESSEDIADTYQGLIRSIKNQSNARDKYNRITRQAVISGFDCARVVTKYCDGDSFDQDLAIERIPNSIDRVWFGYHTEPDASDATHCWILTGIPEDEFEETYPGAPPASLESDRLSTTFMHKPGLVMIGELIYLKEYKQELVKMSDGSVYHSDDDDFKSVIDELADANITIKERKTVTSSRAFSRRFTADDWLDDKPRELPFKHQLPVVPMYGSFDVVEEKVVYWGVIEKRMDPQRVLNYSLSREIEEGALAPRSKYWMTEKQALGHQKKLATLNTNSDPVQFFNPDDQLPGPPQQQGGAQINPGLRNISQAMQEMISMTAGMFAANMGDNPGLQSGVAIDSLTERGERGNNKFLEAREVFERQICRILINAIPEVYEPQRQIRLLGQDGSVQVATIGQIVQDIVRDPAGNPVIDPQTQQPVTETRVIHDVSRGTYEVTVQSAPSFHTRQSETVRAITDIAKADPTVIEMGGDILLGNIPTPGMDDLAARKRKQLFQGGAIPYEQMTPDEQQEFQAMQQQPPQESPEMVMARAEQAKADAEAQKAQADFVAEQNKAQEIQNRFNLESQKLGNDTARLKLDAFLADLEASKAGVEMRKIYAEVVETLARAEKMEAETDSTVTRIDEVLGNAGGLR
jgi:hypothetical protein